MRAGRLCYHKSAKPSAHTANNARLLAAPRGVAVLQCQLSLLRRLAASVLYMLSLGKAGPAFRPSRTILHGVLNEQTASSHRSGFMPLLLNAAPQVYKYSAHYVAIIDWLGHATRSSTMPSFCHISFGAFVAIEPMSPFGACSARISGDRHKDTHIDTQNDYSNPRCACAAKINYILRSIYRIFRVST